MTATATSRSLATARVADVMTVGVICCSPDTPLREVAAIMAGEGVHAVYVFADDTDGWGLVSDLDLVAAGRSDIDTLTARDAAVTPFVTTTTHDTLDRACQLLAENGVAHLAVVDSRTREPVGVLSTLDIARVLAG